VDVPGGNGPTESGERMPDIPAALFREVLGCLPTGVTVVAAEGGRGPVGMAANSFTSVSLEPPMVLLCPARSSSTWPQIRAAGRFCVNVMHERHSEMTRRFAQRGVDRFAGLGWHPRPGGPAIEDAVAWIDCVLLDEHDAGDHTIVVAEVVAIEASEDTSPLVFHRGRYGGFLHGAPEDSG